MCIEKMKGIDEAKKFYLDHGKDMIAKEFCDYQNRIAVGFVGHGSECFGYDDDISRDHDFEVGFCMWLTRDDDEKIGFRLARAYDKLRADCGLKNSKHLSVAGYTSHGVQLIDDFYRRYTGCDGAPKSWKDWLYTDSFYFAEATNGEVFRDDLGVFSSIRNQILNDMPNDVLLKKMSSCAMRMAQSGQYNYARCIAHGENGAAMFALNEFVQNACEMIYLLNRKHKPYYKWVFKGLQELNTLGDMAAPLEFLLVADNDERTQKVKIEIVEDICSAIANEIKKQHLADCDGNYLEPFAYTLNSSIKNAEIRNLYV